MGLCLKGERAEVQIRVWNFWPLTASRVGFMSFEDDNVQKVKLGGCKTGKFFISDKCREPRLSRGRQRTILSEVEENMISVIFLVLTRNILKSPCLRCSTSTIKQTHFKYISVGFGKLV